MSEEARPAPLKVILAEPAEAELDAAYEWMRTFDFPTAEKWLKGLNAILLHEAERQAVVPLLRPMAPDSPPGRAYFTFVYRTSGRRSSPWQISYELLDQDEDGTIDTLYVVRVRHAARGG